jgi:hypothetical protein
VDNNSNGIVEAIERNIVALGEYTVPPTQTKNEERIFLQLKNVANQKWFYPSDNKQYLAMVEFEPTARNLDMEVGFGAENNDYEAYFLIQEMLGTQRYGPIMGVKSEDNWGQTSRNIIPSVRLSVVPIRVKDETLTVEHKMEVFPNPARDVATLSVDLPQVASAIVVQTLDENGRLMQEEIFKNVQKQDLPLNISALASGNYMLRVLTPEGTRTKKLTVVK